MVTDIGVRRRAIFGWGGGGGAVNHLPKQFLQVAQIFTKQSKKRGPYDATTWAVLAKEECICQEVNVANQWYKNNGMIVNEKKHQALILGKTEHNFSFPVNNSIDIFGMTIDNRLSFDNHVSVICKKINNQFNVILRFRKLMNK